MVCYGDGSLDKSALWFFQQGGWSTCSLWCFGKHVEGSFTWTSRYLLGWAEREKPWFELSEVGLDAGRGDWVPTGWWWRVFGKDRGAPGGFGMRRGHSRVPARLIGDCFSSSPLQGNALVPSSRMPSWLACLINWSEWWENERMTQGSHFTYWTLLIKVCIVRFFRHSQWCNQTRCKYTNKCWLKGRERTCKKRWASLTEWVMCSQRGKWTRKQLTGSINRLLIWMTCPWANCTA